MKKVEERYNFNLDLVEWLEVVGNDKDRTQKSIEQLVYIEHGLSLNLKTVETVYSSIIPFTLYLIFIKTKFTREFHCNCCLQRLERTILVTSN